MLLTKRGEEPTIPGFSKGHKINEGTGDREKGNYSSYLEQAEQFLQEARDIKAQIKQKEEATIPGREGEQFKSLKELWGELKDCEDLIKPLRNIADKQADYRQLQEHMTKLALLICEAEQQLGILDLQYRMSELKKHANSLITHDRMYDMALRNKRDDQFVEKNV